MLDLLKPVCATIARLDLSDPEAARRQLEAWPEPELVALGLHSEERQALVLEQTWRETLAPQLVSLELL